MDSQIIASRANGKMAPLISFNTIFDIDVGLIQLIYDEYLDPKVFNIDIFNKSLKDIIKLLYFRTEKNPLYLFANDNISKENLALITTIFWFTNATSCSSDISSSTQTTQFLDLL